MLERMPVGTRWVDRSLVSTVQFQASFVCYETVYPSRFWNGIRRLLGREPIPEKNIPVFSDHPQVEFTVAGADRPFTLWFSYNDDDEAEEVAKWLRREPNKFDPLTA